MDCCSTSPHSLPTPISMESTNSLHIKLLGCKDLKAFNFFQKLTIYALISLEEPHPDPPTSAPPPPPQQQQRTPTDREGGSDPEWNHEIRFDLSHIASSASDSTSSSCSSSSFPSSGDGDRAWFLRFDLRHEGAMFGDKAVGEVRLPLKDLMDESNGVVRFLSYQIRSPDGKPNGVLSFSCRFNAATSNHPIPAHESVVQSVPQPASGSDDGRVHYPILDLEPLPQLLPDYTAAATCFPYPPPSGYFQPPPQSMPATVCGEGQPHHQGGYYYSDCGYSPRAPGGRVQDPWWPAQPDPYNNKWVGGGGFDGNYTSYGHGGERVTWSPGLHHQTPHT